MLLFTPYVKGTTDYDALAKAMKSKGTMLGHVHRVISTKEDEDAAYAFGVEVSDLFLKSSSSTLAPAARTPRQLANDMFRAAVSFVAGYKGGEGEVPEPPLLYLDPTYRPVKTGWLDAIQANFYLQKTPVIMGRSIVQPDKSKRFDGPLVVSKEFQRISGLIGFIPNHEHWRQYLRWELTHNGRETTLIGEGGESVLKPQPKTK